MHNRNKEDFILKSYTSHHDFEKKTIPIISHSSSKRGKEERRNEKFFEYLLQGGKAIDGQCISLNRSAVKQHLIDITRFH